MKLGLLNRAGKNPGSRPYRGAPDGSCHVRTKSVVPLRLILLALSFCCIQPGRADDPIFSEVDPAQPQPNSIPQQRFQQQNRETQELYRKRVAIPDAVAAEAKLPRSDNTAGKRTEDTTPVGVESAGDNLLLAALLFLFGVLGVRRLAPAIAAFVNRRSNCWAPLPAGPGYDPSRLLAEDQAFSEFLSTFQAGPSPAGRASGEPNGDGAATKDDPIREFFVTAPEQILAARKLLQELGREHTQLERQGLLADLSDTMGSVKGMAGLSELLPAWQMASALQGLLKQLTDKASNVNPSTLRTVGSGVDLLEVLCKPGVRPDLATNPPVRLLAVDDERISRNVVSHALKRAFSQPDLAENGEAALVRVSQQPYDVIFLDVQMPGMDGFELCEKIHETSPNCTTPVVFVTCQSDFTARAQSTLVGGHDLIGKPFLTFEITVKALTLTLSARLHGGGKAGRGSRDGGIAAGGSTTGLAAKSTHETLTRNDSLPLDDKAAQPANSGQPQAADGRASEMQTEPESAGIEPDDAATQELATEFLTNPAAHVAALRTLLKEILETVDENERQEMVVDLYLRMHSLVLKADLPELRAAFQLSSALEGLLKKLLEKPANSTPSTLHTIAVAVDLLHDLCLADVQADLATNPPIRILVVDDDPLARRAISGALQTLLKKTLLSLMSGGPLFLAKTFQFNFLPSIRSRFPLSNS